MTSASEWVRFFEDAGIPGNVAATYAVAFSENRMSFNILSDLNKEYLHDMGIKVIGDVILILKHSKTVAGKLQTDKALATGGALKRSTSASATISASKSVAGEKKTVTLKPSTTTVSSAKPLAKSVSSSSIPVKATESGLTQRLGPPQAKPFPERKPPAAVERPSGSGSGGVFNRLGASVNPEPAAPVAKPQAVGVVQKSAFTRLDGRPEANAGLKRKLETAEPRLREQSVESSDDSVKTKKKRYVLIRTLANGTQDRTYISPDDPILKKVAITKLTVPARSASTSASASTVSPKTSASLAPKPSFKNFRVDRPVAFKDLPEISSAQSNFRADKAEVSVRERLSVGASTSRPAAAAISNLNAMPKPVPSGIRGRLSLRPEVESHHQVVRKRISAPGPNEMYKSTKVNKMSNVKNRLSLFDDPKVERSPQRKPTGKASIKSRLG